MLLRGRHHRVIVFQKYFLIISPPSLCVRARARGQELERFKAAQFEDNKQLLREQQAIVHALQMQFEEYRRSAEQIFRIESGKLEDKLQVI